MKIGASIGRDELASRANVTPERVDELARLGLLEPEGDRFVAADVGRIAVVEALVGAGVPLDDLVENVAAGVVSLAWFEGVLPPSPPLRDRRIGRCWSRLGLPPHSSPPVRDLGRDPAAARRPHPGGRRRLFRPLAPAYATLGRDDQRFLEATRYFGDNARRTAEAQISFYRRGILEPLLASGCR